jgi:hypothetical protein
VNGVAYLEVTVPSTSSSKTLEIVLITIGVIAAILIIIWGSFLIKRRINLINASRLLREEEER